MLRPVLRRFVAGVLDGLLEVLGAVLGEEKPRGWPVYGYSLRGWDGQTRYVAITNSPRRRAAQHRRSGKGGRLRVETGGMSRQRARRWEAERLAAHRKRNRGRNPRYNKTDTGGPWG